MNVRGNSARFARYGIDTLITIDVNAMKSVIGKRYDLRYFGGVTRRRTQGERVLLDSCHPSFDIVHGDSHVPRVQLDVIRCIWLDCRKMRVICRESSVAVGAFNNINEALCSALNCK